MAAAVGSATHQAGLHVPLYCYQKINRDVAEAPPSAEVVRALDKAIPSELRQADLSSALMQSGAAVALSVVGVWTLISAEQWWLIPLGWILLSLAMTTLFNIGHDCAHGIWSGNSLLNAVAGEISFLPLAHPFEAFVFKHLTVPHEDDKSKAALLIKKQSTRPTSPRNPLQKQSAGAANAQQQADDQATVASHAMSMLGSLGFRGFFREHYMPSSFPAEVRPRVIRSAMLSVLFFATLFTALYTQFGLLSIAHFWLIPLVLYKEMVYPRWLEWIRRGVDVHLPVEISQSIPSYHLRAVSQIVLDVMKQFDPRHLAQLEEEAAAAAAAEAAAKADVHLEEEVDPQYSPFNYHADEGAFARNDWGSFLKRVNWLHFTILTGTPALAAYGLLTHSPSWQVLGFTFVYYLFTGLGITAGYHRLWAHRAYQASALVRGFLCCAGSGALEGSIKWWCAGHRVHHRYTDSVYDPYDAKQGFWWSHIGWMLMKKNPKHKAKVDIRDLTASKIVNFQHTNYAWMGPLWAFVVPAAICHYAFGDFWGGLYYAGAVRLTFVHHTTFCVNSLAHWLGHHTYDDDRTPRDHIVTAILTLGEGYHNFHHEFPNDYRNGIRWFDYDPTKWFIRFLNFFGLTYNLREFPMNEVSKGQLNMTQKRLSEAKAKLSYGLDPEELPVMSWEEYQERAGDGQKLMLIHGLIHDATHFSAIHPGGQALLDAYVGADATKAFEGQAGPMYRHAKAARNLLSSFRVAKIDPATVPQKKPSQKKQQQK